MAIFKFYDTSAEMDAEIDTRDIMSAEFNDDGSFTIMNMDGLWFAGNDSESLKAVLDAPSKVVTVSNEGYTFDVNIYGDFDDVNYLYKEYSGIDLNNFIGGTNE